MEEENEEAAEGDACGFNEGGVGLPMKYWYHFVYNIVGGVFEGKRRVWGRRSDSSMLPVEHLVATTRGGEREQKEVSERKTEKGGRGGGGVYQAYNRGSPLKNYLFLAGWTVAPPRRSPRLD